MNPFKAIGKIVKGVTKTVKKLAPILLVAAAIYFTGPAGLKLWGAAGAAGAGAAGAAATGAAATGATAAAGTGAAAAQGGMWASVKAAMGSIASPGMVAAAKTVGTYAGYGALTGGGVALITGQDPIKGAKQGALIGAATGGVAAYLSGPAAGAATGATQGSTVAQHGMGAVPSGARGGAFGGSYATGSGAAHYSGAGQLATRPGTVVTTPGVGQQVAAAPMTKFDKIMQWGKDNPMLAAGIVQGGTAAIGSLLDTSAQDQIEAEERKRAERRASFRGVFAGGGDMPAPPPPITSAGPRPFRSQVMGIA